MNEAERFEEGMKKRRAVLGDEHVDRAQSSTDAFNAEFQDLITRYAWGEIWTRPRLDQETRSLLTIALMVALNRADELRMHIKAAVKNGVSREQIKEVLLHCAIYCGVPAANHAFHIATDLFREIDTA